jgi:putative ABC transport system permease protein
MRQALTESVVLALFGGVVGTFVGATGIHLVTAINSGNIPRTEDIRLNATGFAFVFTISILTGIVFGLAPALRLTQAHHMQAIKDSGVAAYSGADLFGRNTIRSLLTVIEIAAAVILLVGAGLLIGSFLKLSSVDRGYNPKNVLTFSLSVPLNPFRGMVDPAFIELVLARLQNLPGVRSAGSGTVAPAEQVGGMNAPVFIEGRPESKKPEEIIRVSVRSISNGFVNAMGMRVIEGRTFDDGDGVGQPPVILVNRTFVRDYFRNEGAIGRRLLLGNDGPRPPLRIVGVIDDVQFAGVDPAPGPEIYLTTQQAGSILPPIPPPPGVPAAAFPRGTWVMGPMVLVVRTASDPLKAVATIRSIVGQVNPELAMDDVATMDQRLSRSVVRPRFYAVLLAIFTMIALILAAIGVYGVIAYSVSQRTREIGIRIAMGAERSNVMLLVLRQGLLLIVPGVVIGTLGALLLTRYLETLLFGLTPTDPLTFTFAVGFITAIAALACYFPARKATQVDLVVALKHE